MGTELDNQTLRRAPKQQALIDYIIQYSNCVAESDVSALFSSAIRKQLQQKGLIESVHLEKPSSITSDEILKQASLVLDKEQQIAMDAINFARV